MCLCHSASSNILVFSYSFLCLKHQNTKPKFEHGWMLWFSTFNVPLINRICLDFTLCSLFICNYFVQQIMHNANHPHTCAAVEIVYFFPNKFMNSNQPWYTCHFNILSDGIKSQHLRPFCWYSITDLLYIIRLMRKTKVQKWLTS